MEKIIYAARHYLRATGQTGTTAQIKRLMDQYSGEAIVRMAAEKGYRN